MTDITLVPVTGSSNISAMNNNFKKVQDSINNDVLNLAGGNNVMKQDLDLNGNDLLNIGVDVNNPASVLTVGTADSRYYNISGDTLTGPMNVNGQVVTGLPIPVASTSPVRKAEFDSFVSTVTSTAGAFQQAGVGAVVRTYQDKMRESVSVLDFGAVGNGTTICNVQVQAALDSGAKYVYLPPGTFLLDTDLAVPAGVTFYGAGDSSLLRMVGRDTHNRNCALFNKYQSIAISAAPCMVVLTGSNSMCRDMAMDGNGLNNYDVSGPNRDYLDETLKHGYGAGRVGRMTNRLPADPLTFIVNSHFYNCSATLTAWGGFIIVGFGYRFAPGDVTTDENLIGADRCSLKKCRTFNTFSNNIATFSAKNFEIEDCTVVNNVHKGIAVYTRCRDGVIKGNTFVYDPTTDVSWRFGRTPAYNREAEFGTRSDAIAVGHSDYNTLIKNIVVTGSKCNGNGMIRNGVNVYSNTTNITVANNDLRGFISPLAIGVSADLAVRNNTLDGNNYTTTDLVPGTNYFGANVQYTAFSAENIKTAPAAICIQAISGNTFKGSGVNHVRGNSWSVWDALGCALQSFYSCNTYSDLNLSVVGAEAVKPVNINSKPSSASQSSITFDGEMHYNSAGRVVDGDNLFFTDQLWTFLRPINYQFIFTPTVIGSTTAGVATGTSKGIYSVDGTNVTFAIEAGWTAHTGTGNLRITGLPLASRSTANGGIPASLSMHFSGLTYTGQAAAALSNSATTIDLYGLTSGGGLTAIAMDTSVNVLRISGAYSI